MIVKRVVAWQRAVKIRRVSERARVGELNTKSTSNIGWRWHIVISELDGLVWSGPLLLSQKGDREGTRSKRSASLETRHLMRNGWERADPLAESLDRVVVLISGTYVVSPPDEGFGFIREWREVILKIYSYNVLFGCCCCDEAEGAFYIRALKKRWRCWDYALLCITAEALIPYSAFL